MCVFKYKCNENVCMAVCVYGGMGVWKSGCMEVWVYGRVGVWRYESMGMWTDWVVDDCFPESATSSRASTSTRPYDTHLSITCRQRERGREGVRGVWVCGCVSE